MDPGNHDLAQTRWSLINRLKDTEDQESWRDFFETYWRLIYNVALKSGLQATEAEDVVQNTVLTVYKQMKVFKPDPAVGSFKSWLLKVARSRISDEFRARGKNPAAMALKPKRPRDENAGATATIQRLPDPAGNFVDAIWDEEWKKNLVHNALEKVKTKASARDFQIFYLYTIKEHDPKAVADITGVSTSYVYVVKTRLLPVFEAAVRQLEKNEGVRE